MTGTPPELDAQVAQQFEERERAGWGRSFVRKRLAFGWLIAFTAGSLVIARSSDDQPATVWWPVIFLAAYAGLGLAHGRKNTAKFADSLYFMGFLWTLVALIVAIQREGLELPQLLVRFGYALVTTGAGMLLRLLFLEFHEALPEQMEDARDEIDIEVAALSAQFRAARADLVSFRMSLKEGLQARLKEIDSVVAAVATAIRTAQADGAEASAQEFDKVLAALRRRLDETATSYKEVGSRANALVETLEAASSRVSVAVSGLARQVATAGEQVDGLGVSVQQQMHEIAKAIASDLRSAFTSATKAVEGGGQRVQQALFHVTENLSTALRETDAPSKLKELSNRFETLSTQAAHLSQSLGESCSESDRLGTQIKKTNDALGMVPIGLASLNEQVASLHNQSLASVATRFAEAERAAADAAKAGIQVDQALRDVLEFLRKHMSASPPS